MANEEQLNLLKSDVAEWNGWRLGSPDELIDLRQAEFPNANLHRADLNETALSEADLSGADLTEANLNKADLTEAKLGGANLRNAHLLNAILRRANLRGANLSRADLFAADLYEADLDSAILTQTVLSGADLRRANIRGADLSGTHLVTASLENANLSRANLRAAFLRGARLVGTDLSEADLREADLDGADLRGANLNGADLTRSRLTNVVLTDAQINNARISESHIFGISAWNLKGKFKEQKTLIITPENESAVTVDNIEVAQFIYLLLNNTKIREVLDTLTSKAVLILGRFTIPERKSILDALKNKVREFGLLPIVFDFERPADKDFTETIKTLAGLSYFVIADVTNPKSSPLELQATVPDYQIPFVPIIQEGESPFAMMVDLQKKYNWVLNTITYDSKETLIKVLKPLIIDPAMKKRQELRIIKAHEPEIISAKDFLKKRSKKKK